MRERARGWTAALSCVILSSAVLGGLPPASAGEPDPGRHELHRAECSFDAAKGHMRATVQASTHALVKDMKNNDTSRVPGFYRLKAKISIQTLRLGGMYREEDHSTHETFWVERRGQWIVKRYKSPPYTKGNEAFRSKTFMNFSDTTVMVDFGDDVRFKMTVWLDKKPGGKVWKYTEYAYATCPNEFWASP